MAEMEPRLLRALGVEAARRRADAAAPPGELLALAALIAIVIAISFFALGCGGGFELGADVEVEADVGVEIVVEASVEIGGNDAGGSDAGMDGDTGAGDTSSGDSVVALETAPVGDTASSDSAPVDSALVDSGKPDSAPPADSAPPDSGAPDAAPEADGGKSCVPGTIFGYPPGEDCKTTEPLDCCSGGCVTAPGKAPGYGVCT